MGLWSSIGAVAGSIIGTVIAPGVGTTVGAAIGGAGGSVADSFGANSSSEDGSAQVASAYDANRINIEEAQKTRDWNERMYKNRYQYTVEDLKAAGLNPMLAVQNSVSSASSGAQAVVKNPREGEIERKISLLNALSQMSVNVASARKLNADTASVMSSLPKKRFFGGLWNMVNSAWSSVRGRAASAGRTFSSGSATSGSSSRLANTGAALRSLWTLLTATKTRSGAGT